MERDEFKRVTEVTYLGVVYGTLAALKRQSAYCAAKHAIAGFTDSLRCELIHDENRIHVTMVQMPALNTAVRLGEQPAETQGTAGVKAIGWTLLGVAGVAFAIAKGTRDGHRTPQTGFPA